MKISIKLEGLDCAYCASFIEEEIKKLPYAKDVVFNFVLSKITCEIGEVDPEGFLMVCGKIVHKYHPEVNLRRI